MSDQEITTFIWTKVKEYFQKYIATVPLFIGSYFLYALQPDWEDANTYKFILSFLNLSAVTIFYAFSLKTPTLEFKKDENERNPYKQKDRSKKDYWDKLNVEVTEKSRKKEEKESAKDAVINEEEPLKYVVIDGIEKERISEAGHNELRVNKLVGQLHDNIHKFAFWLGAVYLLFLVDNQIIFSKLNVSSDAYNFLHSYFKVLEDLFNFISALFIFLAFRVLYDKTLDERNEETKYKHKPYVSLVGFAIISGAFTLFIYSPVSIYKTSSINQIHEILDKNDSSNAIKKIQTLSFNFEYKFKPEEILPNENAFPLDEIKHIADSSDDEKTKISQIKNVIEKYRKSNRWREIAANFLQLFIGAFNGLVMALLFGRYISMEHAVKEISHIKYKRNFTRATIYILPIYALAQPLFGSFEIDAFGDPKWFQNGVFFFCLIGKIFFLYSTWLFMKDRLMHYYLHLILAKYGMPRDFDSCFDFVHENKTNSNDKKTESSTEVSNSNKEDNG